MSKKDLSIPFPNGNAIKFIRGYIALQGPSVEAVARRAIDKVPQDYIQSQIKRDGEHHHITILNKQELSIVQENENNKGEREAKGDIVGRVFEVLWQHATDDWVDLGLGSASKGEDSSYFKVVVWPSANKARRELGLPMQEFHVTLGFKNKDSQDLDRSALSLVYDYSATRMVEDAKFFGDILLEEVKATPATNDMRQTEKLLALLGNALDACAGDTARTCELLALRSQLFGKAKRFSECLEDAERITAVAPHSYIGYLRSGAALFNLKNVSKALEAFTKALEMSQSIQKGSPSLQEDVKSIEKGLIICKKSLAQVQSAPALPEEKEKKEEKEEDVSDQTLIATDPRKRTFVSVADKRVKLPRNFSWVVPGQLAGMSIPKKREHIEALRALGITLLVTAFDDPLPESIFEGTGVRNIFFRVENYRGAALEHLIAFIDEADAEIRRGGAVCAHCGGGKGRAGTLISCFMVRYGLGGVFECNTSVVPVQMQPMEAVCIMRPGSVETVEQEKVIADFANHLWVNFSNEPPTTATTTTTTTTTTAHTLDKYLDYI